MKPGDLIKHKRSDLLAVVTKIFHGRKKMLATVFFSHEIKLSTASLKILEDNWEVISEI
tara:strand:+ start:8463 stop:8639 length:177 start_codon:yes stop_codon:yes gene_type:complete